MATKAKRQPNQCATKKIWNSRDTKEVTLGRSANHEDNDERNFPALRRRCNVKKKGFWVVRYEKLRAEWWHLNSQVSVSIEEHGQCAQV